MNVLAFDIKPSPESNDHQIRIIIDGIDWLSTEHLGIDPPEFFDQKTLFEDGNLLVGRCGCGCVGCDDVRVDVSFSDDEVIWAIEPDNKLSFDKRGYLTLLKEAKIDFSWEDLGRKVERLVSIIFNQKIVENKYSFDWASTRIEPNIVKLSFSKDGEQKLYQFGWDGETIDSAIENAKSFYQTNFREG